MSKKKTGVLLAGIVLILVTISLLLIFFGKEKKQTIIVGMVLTGGIDEPGWNRNHYIGLKEASENYDVELKVKQNIGEGSGESREAVAELIDLGAKLIILGSYNYNIEVEDLITQHPDVSFYCCSSSENDARTPTYFVRAYQARYLAGIIAGRQTTNNKLGYVAAMPNSEVNRGINAFTLGAQSVNPDVEVHVIWTGDWNNEERERNAAKTLIEEVGVDLITYHQNQDFVIQEAEKAGIYSIGYHEYSEGYSNRYLTAVLESWSSVYSEILKNYMQGKGDNKQLIWPGLEKAASSLAPCTELVDFETNDLVEKAKQHFQYGWDVFSGDIISTDGTYKCQSGETISDEILFSKMDWFVKGVIQYEK